MALVKKWVISAIEPTDGASPANILALAKSAEPAKNIRVKAKDYVPAMAALVKKGYSIRDAAKMLPEMGCPFAESTLQTEFHRILKGK